jgi:GDP-L-fucose synthase
VDLRDDEATRFFFEECKPDYVFHCAAKVGGIKDNIDCPATFLATNLRIDLNVLGAATLSKVKKLLCLSSAACYPKDAGSPLSPADLMTGALDETKGGYAMAKLATMQACRDYRKQFGCDFISVIPNNIYGPGDKSSHVVPDLIRKFSAATDAVNCWGTGNARREFIFADDLADACLFLMEKYSGPEPVNVGSAQDWSMRELADLIAKVTGFGGKIIWDPTAPEGTLQRLLDSSVLYGFGWTPKTCLLDGLVKTYLDLCASKQP